jgi:pre-rRNA-processing protein TSR1
LLPFAALPGSTLQLPGDHKLLSADTPQDFKQLLRHLTDSPASVPHWRQERPALLVEAAEFRPQQPADAAAAAAAGGQQEGATGTLLLRGYVRGLGLSVNQAVHIAGAGDFQLSQIDGPQEPPAANEQAVAAAAPAGQQKRAAAAAAMDTSAPDGQQQLPVLAVADPQRQEPLVRENTADPLAGEQTWPTEEVRWRYCCCCQPASLCCCPLKAAPASGTLLA